MTFLTLRSLAVEDSLKGRKITAKLEGDGSARIIIMIKAERKEDIKEVLGTLRKGAVFELKLEQISSLNDRTLDDFQIFEEE